MVLFSVCNWVDRVYKGYNHNKYSWIIEFEGNSKSQAESSSAISEISRMYDQNLII